MKKSLNHLPQIKKDELQNTVEVIRQNCNEVEKIILFGSYARGNYKEEKDLDPNRKSGHVSDYDILAVTKTKEIALDLGLWNDISEKCQKLKLSADPRIITHDIEKLNIKLAEGQYFFSDIKEEGILIYDSGNFELVEERELTGKEKQRIAQDEFDEWFKKAKRFYRHFLIGIEENDNSLAAFHLHQSAEHAYKTTHLVFTNYCPHEHFLKILGYELEEYHPDLPRLFPRDTKENKERLRLLEYAYIGGRYDPEYYISKEDLEILAQDVKKLLEITEKICKEKIANFCKDSF